eukprot:jgi/Chrzof1/14340/UNPLg00614.t1
MCAVADCSNLVSQARQLSSVSTSAESIMQQYPAATVPQVDITMPFLARNAQQGSSTGMHDSISAYCMEGSSSAAVGTSHTTQQPPPSGSAAASSSPSAAQNFPSTAVPSTSAGEMEASETTSASSGYDAYADTHAQVSRMILTRLKGRGNQGKTTNGVPAIVQRSQLETSMLQAQDYLTLQQLVTADNACQTLTPDALLLALHRTARLQGHNKGIAGHEAAFDDVMLKLTTRVCRSGYSVKAVTSGSNASVTCQACEPHTYNFLLPEDVFGGLNAVCRKCPEYNEAVGYASANCHRCKAG